MLTPVDISNISAELTTNGIRFVPENMKCGKVLGKDIMVTNILKDAPRESHEG